MPMPQPSKICYAGRSLALASLVYTSAWASAGGAAAITPSEPLVLFNGRDLSSFYTWIAGHGRQDPNRVFTVVDQIEGAPAIRISGQDFGGIVTKDRFANYHLVAEYRWGLVTWGSAKRRNSGILLHCQGEDGNYRPEFNAAWMRSVEYEILEGSTGDIILVGGHERGRPERIHPTLMATVAAVPGLRAPLWNPDGVLTEFGATRGTRIFFVHKDPEQQNVTGFRGRADAERSPGEWNKAEAICDGGNVTFFLNGQKVNEGTDGSFTEGKILFQSEGSEIYFRRIELLPLGASAGGARNAQPEGFVSLFNGRDLSGWRIPEGDSGHWKVLDGVIDYDARSEAPPGKQHLWTEREYGDFVLNIDWRIKETAGLTAMPEILPDGSYKLDTAGNVIRTERPNADSGIYLRGTGKAQVNIWCWPIGSGQVHGYMVDKNMPPEVRAGVVPKVNADKPVGEWNTFQITMRGDRLTVILNGRRVIENAQLPGVPARGPIGLQHHGGFVDGKYKPASSLMQFRNISIKELKHR